MSARGRLIMGLRASGEAATRQRSPANLEAFRWPRRAGKAASPRGAGGVARK
jgi:hypothetical protein